MRDLPSGTVTFLFTDIEGSTKLLETIGDEAYEEALAEHRYVIRGACSEHGGVEVDTQGDAFFFAFPTAPGAVAAASELTMALAASPIRVRVGLHTGKPRVGAEGYVGKEVHFAARVAATGHGGQVVLSKATRDLLEGLELKDLGEHRLKDIPQAVPIFQLGSESFPPLKTISNTNLPRPASSFVGRETELGEVLERIEHGARLLTLTGPGGSGKTRLALEAAATLVPSYKAGVFWVGLAALRDPALVTETIAQTLGAKEGLAEHIAERELLLLLDNLEQVAECASELSALLQACPNLSLLVTSRELLRVQGEVEYAIPPLASPEAVDLFCERSRLEPSVELAELCARLDNLPLAVELAAARTKALSPAQILERLSGRLDLFKGGRDADPRQQTLEATIAWSYDLLTETERQLFRRLSVFAGGCTLEAAEEVCEADIDILQSLVEKSLLRFSGGHYWMLETIREYAGERLEESGLQQVLRQRHSDHVHALVRRAREGLRAPDGLKWLDTLERELDNLRAALGWLGQTDQSGAQLEVIGSTSYFWEVRGLAAEGLRWLVPSLDRTRAERTARRGKALEAAGAFAGTLGESEAAKKYLEESRSIYLELGDDERVALVLSNLAIEATVLGDYAEAAELIEVGFVHARRSGSLWPIASLVGTQGNLALQQGEFERAIGHFEKLLELAPDFDDEGRALYNLGSCFAHTGRWDEALRAGKRSLILSHGARDFQFLVWEFVLLASFAIEHGNLDTAAILIGSAEALRDESRWILTGAEAELYRAAVAQLDDVLGDAQLEPLRARGRVMTLDEAVEYALGSLD